jgi:hypothetical protein
MIFGIVRYVSQEGNDRRGVYHSRSSSRQVPGYAVDDGKPGDSPPVNQVATTAGADPTTAAPLLTNEATERTYFWCPDVYN